MKDKNFTKPIAHSENGQGDVHFLSDHLKDTSALMTGFSSCENYTKIFRVAGLVHDFGKYQNAFQEYLLNNGPRAPHAAWGAGLARELKLNEISFAVDGHHKGLPDQVQWQISTNPFESGSFRYFNELYNKFLKDICIDEKQLKLDAPKFENIYEREFFVRYLFSSLTDADWLDTEKHFSPGITKIRPRHVLDHGKLITSLENEIRNKSKEGFINRLRNETRNFALLMAKEAKGFYSLTLPTGLGKTLTSVNWALEHAKYHKMSRIIIVLPYVNIIDQTAKELKRIFGNNTVLEHHASYNEEKKKDRNIQKVSKEKLATENWDFPIIVTTTVQFFESIFANKPSKCRKLHNIANAVVVFDEVQTLPKELVTPTLTIIQNMQKIMGTSFLFCTATQPAFEKNEKLKNGISPIISLVENPTELFKKTKRVSYEFLTHEKAEIDDIILRASKKDKSVLIISNTKKKAKQIFSCAESTKAWDKYFHLSTAMCPAHRKEVIESIKSALLKKSTKIFVSSTQLIEAGVDLDFPVVMREQAPLDSIIQAAGRCNREGKNKTGEVIIFRLKDETMPDALYASLSAHTLELIEKDENRIHDPDFFAEFYLSALKLYVDDDKKKINDERKKFNFKTVASLYKIIEKSTKLLFIWDYNELSKKLYEQIKFKPALSREDYRNIQEYSVQVYDSFLNKNAGMWEEKLPGFLVWFGGYNKCYGITNYLETII